MTDHSAGRGGRKAAVIFIYVTIMLDMLAMSLIIPVLPKLVLGFVGENAASAGRVIALFGTVWAVMQFLFMPVLGGLSDRYGRRPVVLISNFGMGLDYLLMALAPNLTILFIGRMISGITSASISTASAYIADVTPKERRAKAFGRIGAAFGVGFIVGPAIGGLLARYDPRAPFWAAAGFSLLNACYGLIVLPESLAPEHRAAFRLGRANPIGALRFLAGRPMLFGLAGILFLHNVAHVALPSTFVLYTSHRYLWDPGTIGLTLAGFGLGAMIVQGGLVQPAMSRFGERILMLSGLAFGVVGFVLFALAPFGWMIWIATPLLSLWGFFQPAAQGVSSRLVGPDEQGQLQGALSSLQGVAAIAGPALFPLAFAYSVAPEHGIDLPGAPFLLAAGLLVLALGLAERATPGEAGRRG